MTNYMIHEHYYNRKGVIMKKIALLFTGVFLLTFSSSAFADNVQLWLMANGDTVAFNMEYQFKKDFGSFAAGGGIEYARGDYTIGEGIIALRRDQLVPGVRFGLGFKGYVGRTDSEDESESGNIAALAFLIEGAYELTSSLNPVPLPVEAYGAVSFSPSSLSFDETESLQEYKGGVRFYLIESAFLFIECKYRKIEFEESGNGEWDRDDTILAGGVTLRF
jgi:hypothetical protein